MHHDNTLTKMLATTAVLAAVAALLAGPAGAMLLDADSDSVGGSTAVAAASRPRRDPVPEPRHRRRRDALRRNGDAPGRRRARHDSVPQPRDRGRRVPVLRRALARAHGRLCDHARVGARARGAHRRLGAGSKRDRDRLERQHDLVGRRRLVVGRSRLRARRGLRGSRRSALPLGPASRPSGASVGDRPTRGQNGAGLGVPPRSLFARRDSAEAESCGLIPAYGGADP